MKASSKFLMVLLLVGAIAGVLLQRSAISEASGERQARLEESRQIEKLRRENARIGLLRQESLEIAKLRGENQELHKLRNEVRELREQAHQLPGLRAENQRLRASHPTSTGGTGTRPEEPEFIQTGSLVFSGYATPEAAFKSMLWAMSQGDAGQVLNSVTPEIRDKMKTRLDSEGVDSLKAESARMKRFRVAATRMTSDTEALLGLQIESEGDDPLMEIAVPVTRVGSEWKLSFGP